MVNISPERFDVLCNAFDEMEYKCGDWFPSMEEIKTKLEPNIEDDIFFALWVLETSNTPKTPEGVEARRYLMSLVYSHLNVA